MLRVPRGSVAGFTFILAVAGNIAFAETALVSEALNAPIVADGANGHSYAGSTSADGRFIAFESRASNLVASDPNGPVLDVFVHDRDSAARVPRAEQGAPDHSGARPGQSGIELWPMTDNHNPADCIWPRLAPDRFKHGFGIRQFRTQSCRSPKATRGAGEG